MSHQQNPAPGRYRHYKGQHYQVLDTATHSETGERLVVYRCLYGEYELWVRPLDMFLEQVTVTDETGQKRQVSRFALVEAGED